MADFSALKTSIQNYIKQNGNNEITGAILQQILLSMVTALGDNAINDLVSALGDEVSARQNADGTLQDNIDNEATARSQADGTLQQNINNEATARENADGTLQTNINNEATARGNADTELGGRITTLQGVVNGIIANIQNGYFYVGIATPSATPISGKVFYLALTAGTYTNFGATVVPQGINILKYNGTAWVLDSFLGLDDAPTQGSNSLVKSGGVASCLRETNELLGFDNNLNLLGLDRDYYPVDIHTGEYISVSTSDGSNFSPINATPGALQIQFFDENKTQVDYFGLGTNVSYRVIHYTKVATVKYIKLNLLSKVPLMVNYGNTPKTYVPYITPTTQQLKKLNKTFYDLNVYSNNLIGNDFTKLYPVEAVGGDVLTISSPDSDWSEKLTGYGLQIQALDSNMNQVNYWGVAGLPKTFTTLYNFSYIRFNKPVPVKVQLEFGATPTEYRDYTGNDKMLTLSDSWEQYAVQAYQACLAKQKELNCNGIPVFIETDIHNNFSFMLKPSMYVSQKDSSIKLINLGDNLEDWDDNTRFEFAQEGKKLDNYICVAGNHDIAETHHPVVGLDYLEINELYTGLSVDYRKPSQRPHFVSYDNHFNVKYLVICPYYIEDTNNGTPKVKTEQMKWIIDELSRNDGYDIVILMHAHVTNDFYTREGEPFHTSYAYPAGDTMLQLWTMMKDRRNKRSGTITDSEGVVHNYDFSNCKNDFLCLFHGHLHQELYLTEDNTTLYVSTTTGGIDMSTSGFTDGACTLALIDRESKHLYIWAFNGNGVNPLLTLDI